MAAWITRALLLTLAVLGLPNDETQVTHTVNRLSFGARPGDIEHVKRVGLDGYIDEQLHPERLSDAGVDARVAPMTTLRMSSRDIAEQFETPQLEARRAAAASGNANQLKPDPALQQRATTPMIELQQQKMLRAIYSTRQLQEVLVDFWFNHFNVDARKGADRFMLTEYERDVIRPRVFGKFRDLLGATAKSPAMLFYLDNWMSVDPNGPHLDSTPVRVSRGPFGRPTIVQPAGRMPRQNKNAPKGLNENYGRELMELHTLGVDGGYTQQDVTEVARAFTGWTIEQPRQGGGFTFDPRRHDDGKKVVLGHVVNAGGGQHDGEEVLDILATHPSTARFIATKLVRRFVSDTPPASLVDRVAARFRATDGDLREVVRTILTSPEFFAADAYRAKIKTPFEFVVSAVRAADAEVHDARALVRQVAELGEPLYQCQPPTGYKDTADAWVNTGALVGRMNFALALAGNQLRGVIVSNAQPDGVELGKPEFQRR
jgi:uncharacterized protein (DUF1800 family)